MRVPVFFILAGGLCLFSCKNPVNSDMHLVYHLPVGFKGIFSIAVGGMGTDVQKENGTYDYHIPSSGRLLIKDRRPLEEPHTDTAIYENGMPIPVDGLVPLTKGEVGIFHLGTDKEGETSFFLGSYEDNHRLRQLMSNPGLNVIKPGPVRFN